MSHRSDFSDEDLSAYLDGEAPAPLAARIDDACHTDPALETRLDDLRAGQEAFSATMGAALKVAPAMPELPPPANVRAPRPWGVAIASAAAGAVLSIGLGWSLWPSPESGWRDVVANYQSLYVTETLALVDQPAAEQQADLRRISEGLGLNLTELPQVAGLTFKRAQQLGYQGQPLAQLTFLTEEGGPVALCVLYTGHDTSPGIAAEVLSGLDTYSWSDNGFGLLLVGPKGAPGLENAAKRFRDALKDAAV